MNDPTSAQPIRESVQDYYGRVLKPGGELYFSDVFVDRRIPRALAAVGCLDARVVSSSPLAIGNPVIAAQTGNIRLFSMTVRAFKLALEDRCENFGQVATCLGTEPHHPHAFVLDDHHRVETGRPMRVCGNAADMLGATRYAPHFRVQDDKATRFGLFDCGPTARVQTSEAGAKSGCC